MKAFCLVTLLCLASTATLCQADSWLLPPEVKDTPYVFGDTRVVLHYDSTRSSLFPDYTLRIYHQGKLVAEHTGIGFEQVFASPDNSFFVAVSNSGLTKDAYVVFDRQGKLLKRQPHDPGKVHYHTMSVSIIRKWCDVAKPNVKFDIRGGDLQDVSINDCDGKPVSLIEKAAAQNP